MVELINELKHSSKPYDVVSLGESMIVFSPDNNGPLRYVNNFTKSLGGAE